jgi:hypothetical protein
LEKSIADIPVQTKYGINITKFLKHADTEAELFLLNSGEGEAMEGGPCCYFKVKKIPTFLGASPKANITKSDAR